MTRLWLTTFFACSIAAGVLLAKGTANEAGSTKPRVHVEIHFEPEKGIELYEVQWLKKQEGAAGKSEQIEKVTKTPILKLLPTGFKFFRLRAVLADGSTKPWSKPYPVSWFVQGDDEQQQQFRLLKLSPTPRAKKKVGALVNVRISMTQRRDYLANESLDLGLFKLESGSGPIYYRRNRSRVRKFEKPLVFPDDGEYAIEFYREDEKGEVVSPRQIEFWVDRTPPQTKAYFSKPNRYRAGTVRLGGASPRLYLRAQDQSSGIEKSYYRIFQLGEKPGEFSEYTDPVDLKEYGNQKEARLVVQVHSIDRMGNKEKSKTTVFVVDGNPPRYQLLASKVQSTGLGRKVGVIAIRLEDLSQPVRVRSFINSELVGEEQVRDYFELRVPGLEEKNPNVRLEFVDSLDNKSEWEGSVE